MYIVQGASYLPEIMFTYPADCQKREPFLDYAFYENILNQNSLINCNDWIQKISLLNNIEVSIFKIYLMKVLFVFIEYITIIMRNCNR